MKRIEYIVNGGKETIKKNTDVRERKLKRTFEAMIDNATENALEAKDKAEDILNGLKHFETADDITRTLNNYIDKMVDAESYERSKKILTEALEKLNDEVETEVEEEKK